MHERHRSVRAVHRPEQRQRDRVIAAERDERAGGAEQLPRAGLHLVDRLGDIERGAGDVAGVGDLLARERLDGQPRVVAAHEPRARPDRRRTEPGAGPIGHPAVERDTDDRHVAPVDLVEPRQPRVRRGPGEPRNKQRLDRPERLLAATRVLHPAPLAFGWVTLPARHRGRHPC